MKNSKEFEKIRKVEKISEEQLDKIRTLVGEAFVTNEMFHNWGTIDERREDVMKYLALYVDYVYQAGGLYAKMYQHLGCELYNTVKADNGVTRYSLCYKKEFN